MTIASEIERLQTAKSCIKAAIEDKGVEVGSDLTLDEYANCIASIKSGGGIKAFSYLLVGGGGGGAGAGGGGGEVLCNCLITSDSSFNVIIGTGGSGAYLCNYNSRAGTGGNSCIGSIVAHGGYGGGWVYSGCCDTGGDSGSGYIGGKNNQCYAVSAAGGGAGAGGDGCPATNSVTGGDGGPGLYGYGGGGGGGGCTYGGAGSDGGGTGGRMCPCRRVSSPTNCGGGGGGAYFSSGSSNGTAGAKGIAKICYPTDGSYGITCATGGTKSTSGSYIVHTFTSNGTFCIIC